MSEIALTFTPCFLDVTQPPFGADPSGKRDSTAAIVAAIDAVAGRTLRDFQETLVAIAALSGDPAYLGPGVENRKVNGQVIGIFPRQLPYAPILYFPPGEYQVSDTLGYTVRNLQNSFGSELAWQLRFRGAGPERSVLRLRDNCAGFEAGAARPVVHFMRGEKSNVCMSNYFEDLGIHTGSGNPGAVGLDFFANNSGAVRRVRITSGDGQGAAGLQLANSNYSGILISDVEVTGFDYGANFDSGTRTMFVAAERLHLRGARVAGVRVGNTAASLRSLRVETAGQVPALRCDGESAHVVLLDSALAGQGGIAIEHRGGVLYASNIAVSGFAQAWSSAEFGSAPAGPVEELVLPRALSEGAGMARLPVEETPAGTGAPLGAGAVGVREFGALGDGVADDSAAIQRALSSGAAEISFEPGRYLLAHPVRIPAGVNRVRFNFADLVAGAPLQEMKGRGAFIIEGESEMPLVIEDLFAWEGWRGDHVTFEHASRRTLVLSDLHTQTLCLYRNTVPGGKVFLENVACTAGVVPGTVGHGRACAIFTGQQVWARQFNPERGEPMVRNDGGTLWVLGFKSEDEGIAFETVNGGRTEILGGILNGGAEEATAISCQDSAVRISAATNGWVPERCFGTAIETLRKGETVQILTKEDCVSRHFPEGRGPQYSITLWSGSTI